MKLVVVSASLDREKTRHLWSTWRENAMDPVNAVWVENGADRSETAVLPASAYGLDRDLKITSSTPKVTISGWQTQRGSEQLVRVREVLGTVPAFRRGVDAAVSWYKPDIIACFHDDLAIMEKGWDTRIRLFFELCAANKVGICAGLSGAPGVGMAGMYEVPYDPMTLARHGFMSNMRDAESHGERQLAPRRVVYSDGFSLIGPAGFVQEAFRVMDDVLEITHHAYDVAFAALAAQCHLEYWYLPIACHHHGGLNATDPRYTTKFDDGEAWKHAHQAVYEYFKGTLPLKVQEQRWRGKVYAG